jgi:hypothetical protein
MPTAVQRAALFVLLAVAAVALPRVTAQEDSIPILYPVEVSRAGSNR